MVDIINYISLSKTAVSVNSQFTTPDEFSKKYKAINFNEKNSYFRHYIVNNSPFFVKDMPILFEQLAQYLADKLEINPSEVKLIGSAKTGFSISPSPKYGMPFGSHSDLDFSIINEGLFEYFLDEFTNWKKLYKQRQIKPQNNTEEKYWNQNLNTGQIKHNFIDTNLIPNLSYFPTTKKINNSLYLIKVNLDTYHSIKIKKATASIYKNWAAFAGRLNRNTEHILKTVE